jgi:hypothetical protein
MNEELWCMQRDAEHMIAMGSLIKESVPQPWEAPIDKVAELAQWYYQYHGAGGWLHIVLDDGNLEDHSVDHCIQRAEQEGDIVCWLLAGLIRTMTEDNRDLLYEKLHGHKASDEMVIEDD